MLCPFSQTIFWSKLYQLHCHSGVTLDFHWYELCIPSILYYFYTVNIKEIIVACCGIWLINWISCIWLEWRTYKDEEGPIDTSPEYRTSSHLHESPKLYDGMTSHVQCVWGKVTAHRGCHFAEYMCIQDHARGGRSACSAKWCPLCIHDDTDKPRLGQGQTLQKQDCPA